MLKNRSTGAQEHKKVCGIVLLYDDDFFSSAVAVDYDVEAALRHIVAASCQVIVADYLALVINSDRLNARLPFRGGERLLLAVG